MAKTAMTGASRQGFQVAVEENRAEGSVFSKEQLEQLQALLSNTQMIHPTCPTPTPMCTIAQKGNHVSALGAKSDSKNSWIVDSGASDHMTGCHELFSTYNPCPGNLKIRIADGSLSSVAGKGNIKLSNMTLFSVLHVPNLTCNLVSISKLTNDLNCVAKYYPSYCEF